ncbi:MAG: transcriptional regulator, partial [Bacteroidales bacterium]|nr:transcriptional regulator [Bacteroidales bacterium]
RCRFEKAKLFLKKKEAEKLKLKEAEFIKENMLKEQKIIQLKNDNLEAEVLQKKTEMELKNKELASVAIQITHKNEILTNLKSKIESISLKVNNQAQLELRQLIKAIDEDLKLDEDWEQFKMHFEDVHSDFFKRLRKNYIELTPKDLKMCAYLRMNLSTKEIAPLMSISVRGVEISRYRLRKKLGLDKEANLIEFMLNI